MFNKVFNSFKSFFSSTKHRVEHKLEHFSVEKLKKAFVDGGLPLFIIIVVWEIIEDVLFPVVFGALGFYVHPIFYAGIPAAWMLCLHWLAVPVLWGIWLKVSNKHKNKK